MSTGAWITGSWVTGSWITGAWIMVTFQLTNRQIEILHSLINEDHLIYNHASKYHRGHAYLYTNGSSIQLNCFHIMLSRGIIQYYMSGMDWDNTPNTSVYIISDLGRKRFEACRGRQKYKEMMLM